MTKEHLHLEPSKLKDSSTGTAGVIASELIAEEELLLQNSQNYDAINDNDNSTGKTDGYAMSGSKFYTILVAMYFAAFLSALDATVVSTLLTVIASDLDQIPNMSWIATAYLLSSAAFQPLYGKISDIFGRKPVLIVCSIFFSVGCFICSFNSFYCVVIGRFVTGMGGSGFNTVGTISMSDIIPLRERGVYQGMANVAFSVGAASGGILGGLINDWLGWQYVFSIQVPLAISIGFVFYFFFELPEGSPGLGSKGHIKEKLSRVDFLGSFLLVSSLITILLAASLGNQYFLYTSWTFVFFVAVACALLGGFAYVELYVAPEPILPVTLMAERTILASSLTNWFSTMACFTYIFYYPLYLSAVLQLPSSKVGLRIIGNFFGVSFGSLGAGIYMKQTGRYYNLAVVSSVILWIGILNFSFLTPSVSVPIQMILMAIPGCFYAVLLTVTLLALIAAAPVKYQAGTTSIQYTFRSTGSTLGVSIASAIFQSILTSTLEKRVPMVVHDPEAAAGVISGALRDAGYAKKVPEAIGAVITGCYDAAAKGGFHFALGAATLGLISSLFMREHKLHSSLDRD